MSDDTAVHERPCVYCQLDSPDAIDALEERCDLGSNELLLVPDDEADGMISHCLPWPHHLTRLCQPVPIAAKLRNFITPERSEISF